MKIHVTRFRAGPQIDMTPDGQFVGPRPETPSEKLLRYGIVTAVLVGMVALAGLALWLALILIPVAVAAGLIAYGAYRWRVWRLSRANEAGPVSYRPPYGP